MMSYHLSLFVLLFIISLSLKPSEERKCRGGDTYSSFLGELSDSVKIICRSVKKIIDYVLAVRSNYCCVFNEDSCESAENLFNFYHINKGGSGVEDALCYYTALILFYTACDCPIILHSPPPPALPIKPPANAEDDLSCGLSGHVSPRIVGGDRALLCEYPWMAHVKVKNYVCGGVIIDENHVLTSAYCAGRGRHDQMSISLGSIDNQKLFFNYGVRNYTIHPRYSHTEDSFYHDIAMLRLSVKIVSSKCIRPICLPDGFPHDITNITYCFTAGWGINKWQEWQRYLKKVRVPILSSIECIKYIRSYRPGVICAGYPGGGKDGCLGDLGGPLMCPERNQWVLAGISSFGYGCAMPNLPGVYTDVKYHINWITKFLHR